MGLDMGLYKAPRYKDATIKDVFAIESYFHWKRVKEEGSKYANCTLEQWCGVKWEDVPGKEYRDFYSKFNVFRYPSWDKDKRYGSVGIVEDVGYWRKANAIHKWFVDNVQDGIDDCDYHNEVTKEILEDLLDTCEKVIANSKLIDGKIVNGYTFDSNMNKVYNWQDGKVIENPRVAQALLPTQEGFFFGSYDYDEWYLRDIQDTINIITRVLETTDFENEMIYYSSSW